MVKKKIAVIVFVLLLLFTSLGIGYYEISRLHSNYQAAFGNFRTLIDGSYSPIPTANNDAIP